MKILAVIVIYLYNLLSRQYFTEIYLKGQNICLSENSHSSFLFFFQDNRLNHYQTWSCCLWYSNDEHSRHLSTLSLKLVGSFGLNSSPLPPPSPHIWSTNHQHWWFYLTAAPLQAAGTTWPPGSLHACQHAALLHGMPALLSPTTLFSLFGDQCRGHLLCEVGDSYVTSSTVPTAFCFPQSTSSIERCTLTRGFCLSLH